MHKYRVVDCCEDQNSIVLEGGVGRFHRARMLKDLPRVGALLYGSLPHLGFGLLKCPQSTRTYRVIFETINNVDPRFNGLDSSRVDLDEPAPAGLRQAVAAMVRRPASAERGER